MPVKPRLLVVVTLAETGGAQTFVRSLVDGLRDEYAIDVAAHGPNGPVAEACASYGIPFHHLPNLVRKIDPSRDPRAVLEIKQLVARLRPEIVQINSSKAGVLARIALAGSGIPAVFTAHGWAFAGRKGLSELYSLSVERVMASLSSAIVCVSEWDRSLAIARHVARPDRFRVIHNGIAAPATSPERGLWPLHPVLVCATRLVTPQKDVALLLSALAQRGLEPWHLRIIGDGPERAKLEVQRDSLGLGDRVEIMGERNDVAEQLSIADAFVLPSRWEGLPYSILEAMAAGLPVVASRVGGVPELVVDGVTGFVVEPGSVSAMADALKRLHSLGNGARALGLAGHQRARESFTLEKMLTSYDALFRTLLSTRPQEPSRLAMRLGSRENPS